jgi:hypothetical protein
VQRLTLSSFYTQFSSTSFVVVYSSLNKGRKLILPEKPLTKRQLGILAIVLSILMAAGIFLYDAVGLGSEVGGFGPTQKVALLAVAAGFILGLSLIPLGDQQA